MPLSLGDEAADATCSLDQSGAEADRQSGLTEDLKAQLLRPPWSVHQHLATSSEHIGDDVPVEPVETQAQSSSPEGWHFPSTQPMVHGNDFGGAGESSGGGLGRALW